MVGAKDDELVGIMRMKRCREERVREMSMNKEKESLIQQILENSPGETSESISTYLEAYPYDVDMYVMAGFYYLGQEDLHSAERFLRMSLEHNYYDVDTRYLLGEVYFMEKEFVKAMEFYTKSSILYSYFEKEYLFFSLDACAGRFEEAQQALQQDIAARPDHAVKFKEELDRYVYAADQSYYLLSSTDQLKYQLGDILHFADDEKRFCGCFEPCDLFSSKPRSEQLRPVYRGKEYAYAGGDAVLLPIAPAEPDADLRITLDSGEAFHKAHIYPNHFNYFRTSRGLRIESDCDFTVGEPVRLGQKESLKKLVASLFVDGFSWQLIREEGLEKVMPNTFRFFSKGLICENFFTTSDWTYPSLPSFITGWGVPEHMMVHPGINRSLPGEADTLFAHMKKAGYYTAMFNCDPRTSSIYGYTRDIDRNVTQHPVCYKAKQIMPDVLEHMHAFRETNQYLWIAVPDLHDIADEVELSLDTVARLDIARQKSHEKSATSIKQKYSLDKRMAYIQALRAVDVQFLALYRYVEDHFGEEEFVVTMFGDHGQTYLIPPEGHHLSRYHSNAGFLLRGSVPRGRSEEYISATDYSHILCKLAGTAEFQSRDGRLPQTFGGDGRREFVITETIHPGDPYRAAIHAPTHAYYYASRQAVTADGRLEPGGGLACLEDAAGRPMDDLALMKKYAALIDERLKYIYMY